MLDGLVDESDPDVDFPNSFHAFQTAEGIRKAHPDKGVLPTCSDGCWGRGGGWSGPLPVGPASPPIAPGVPLPWPLHPPSLHCPSLSSRLVPPRWAPA